MRKLTMLWCTVWLLCTGTMMAQQVPTLADWMSGIPQSALQTTTGNRYAYQWWGDQCMKIGVDTIYTLNPNTGKEKKLITREEVNQVIERQALPKISTLTGVQFLWQDDRMFLINLRSALLVFDFSTHTITRNTPIKASTNMDYEPVSGHVAYTIDNNLYVDNVAVTNEAEGVVCGQSVHRNEFGISKGTFWSPKGALLAFYRMDESMVTQYPLVDITQRIAALNNVRYPMAGMTSHKVSVGVYNPATKKTVYLQTGDPTDRYFTNISWSPDEKNIYLIEINREQNHAKLCRYDAATGDMQAIVLEEKHPKYVEPQNPITFLPWDATKFIYQSQRDGWNHLYLYDTAGKELAQLTQGEWVVKELLGFNKSKKQVLLTGTAVSPLQTNVYAVSVPTGKRIAIGNQQGVHRVQPSASGTHIIDSYSTPEIPRRMEIVKADASKSAAIILRQDKDYFEGYLQPNVKVGTIKAADGQTDLYYRLTTPPNLDPAKKYPVIVYVYGGPHAQMITAGYRYGVRGWDAYMANKGYILFTLDNRGSSNRGLEFENCTFRHLGIEECKDQVQGIEFLKTLPYVDAARIGVHGWSYGGHMTTGLMLRYPDIYKVGVAGGPVIDWKYYEIMYGERYMDTPQTNPEGYNGSNLNRLAGQLKGRLMLIHDDHDDTCVPQHSLSFLKACIDARTYPDFFMYPGHKHNVSGRDRLHLYENITRYFEDHL